MDREERDRQEEDEQEDQEEDAPMERPERRQRREAQNGAPHELHNLLRILARQRVVLADRARAATNADLVAGLRESGMLTSENVARAMLAVPRGSFVPVEYRDEAYVDAPIRVDAEDFNISAPHMHAAMLEAMRIRPGDRFLDVGCGCGVLAACAAMMVGRQGRVAGVDTRSYCVELSADNVDRLRATSPDYAAASCEVDFEQHNIFLPSKRYRGQYNKVCVGAACPEERVHLLLLLLPQEPGALLLAPVDTDLRLYERKRDGAVKAATVSSVRFSELEVPTDATVALAMLEDARSERMEVRVSVSTFDGDMGALMAEGEAAAAGQGPADAGMKRGDASPAGDDDGSAPKDNTTTAASAKAEGGSHPGSRGQAEGNGLSRASSNSVTTAARQKKGSKGSLAAGNGSSNGSSSGGGGSGGGKGVILDFEGAFTRVCGRLGEPDYVLHGAGWQVGAHKEVLKTRCPHFRARLSSGMRDADGGSHTVPEAFPQHSVQVQLLLTYLYTDALLPGLEAPQLADLLHVGSFYGCTRLTELCEERLVNALLQLDPQEGAAEAPSLLRLGGELGLTQLQRVSAAYIAQHYREASKSEAYAALSKPEVDLVAAELAEAVEKACSVLKELQPPEGTPTQTVAQRQRILWW